MMKKLLIIYFFALIGACSIGNINAQSAFVQYKCDRDRLDHSTVRIIPDPMTLTVGQNCKIEVFNNNGKSVPEKNFNVSSNNRNVKSSGLTFYVENAAKGNPFEYLDGKLVEIEGTITITAKECTHRYDFPFQVRQNYVFDNSITCRGESREFAVARYKNVLNKELYIVRDITKNQIYLMEAPITIDASGIRGKDGASGERGKSGANGTASSYHGSPGGDGGRGGDGGPGGDGGNIKVYVPHNSISVNAYVAGGAGGSGGKGGEGGKGGYGYKEKIGTKKNSLGITVPVYKEYGKDGRDGNNGRPGYDGRPGRDGNFNRIVVNDIKNYFEGVFQKGFSIENIDAQETSSQTFDRNVTTPVNTQNTTRDASGGIDLSGTWENKQGWTCCDENEGEYGGWVGPGSLVFSGNSFKLTYYAGYSSDDRYVPERIRKGTYTILGNKIIFLLENGNTNVYSFSHNENTITIDNRQRFTKKR